MKKMKWFSKVIAFILCLSMVSTSVVPLSYAGKIEDAEAQKRVLEKKKKELSATLSDLENEKDDILLYIEKIDRKMNKISQDMSLLEKKITKRKNSIKDLKEKIIIAEVEIESQYETMKKRIKYMYENGNAGYIDILMNSKNISDLLNRSEYIEKISAYDAGLLETFIANKTSLQEKKADLINKKKQLQLEKEELAIEEEALQEIATKKTVELEQYNTDITNAETSMNENDLELERQEQIITEALLEQQKKIAEEEKRREEEAKRLAEEAAKKNENSDGTEVVTPTKEPSTTIDTTGFGWPLSIPGTITSYFGHRTSPTAGASSYHQGIDISASTGTPIFAANAGTVVTASYSSGAGNYVMINHGGGVFTVYMHASKLAVSVNQEVKKGQTIAYVGSTGISTGPHLHFGVSVKGSYVNPLNYVSQ